MTARQHVRIKHGGQLTHAFPKNHASHRPHEGTAAPPLGRRKVTSPTKPEFQRTDGTCGGVSGSATPAPVR